MSDASDTPIRFPPELPISARAVDIARAIDAHPVVIVAGATGSGKTTQLPKIALAMGRGLEKIIGVTQPRRIAATSVAARVASELGTPLGTDVGYQIRFDDRTSPSTYVKFMTDGILLAEIHGDPLLSRYDTLVIDEAHERSLSIDFLLGWLKRILPQRPDLKVIVSSATLETERFSAHFGGAPVIQVEGRTFPVDVLYEPPAEELDLPEAVANAVANVTSLDPHGDILVFLPGEREIRETEQELLQRQLKHTVIQPLYARLSGGEQSKVFQSIPQRRVILATNVAETSVTIPGIVYVVDAGVARISRYDPRSGTTRLQVEAISKASAEQRKGRCGRVRDGICVRLYDEVSFAARPDFTDPEIKRTGLAAVILRMKALGLGDPADFPFLDPPGSRAITDGYRVLEELGAIDEMKRLTPIGERLARFPADPRIGRMILAGAERGALGEVLVVAAALNVQDPRERPREAQGKADEAHRKFRSEGSDFAGLLKIWEHVRQAERRGRGQLRRACRESFLSYPRVREWIEIHRQLEEIVKELRLDTGARSRPAPASGGRSSADPLHESLATGLLSKIGMWLPEPRVYAGARQTRFAIHPSSALSRKPPAWVMAFELVETSQLFARMVAKIEPDWLHEVGAHVIKKSYSGPHWAEKSARAMVKENATLFGLPLARERNVAYATVAPAEARKIFIEHALVRSEFTTPGAFQTKNRALMEEVARLRDKARRSDMMADEDALFAFFDARVPESVVDGKTFEAWREKADESTLLLTTDDVLTGDQSLAEEDYPDAITLHGAKIAVSYRFDPSADDDGITLTIPLVLVPQLDPGELEWTVPGYHEEKIAAVLYELPRALRKEVGEIPDLARRLARELRPFTGSFGATVARAAGVDSEAIRPDAVASYLRATVRIVDENGKVVGQGKDAGALLERYRAKARATWRESAPPLSMERKGLASWDFGDLPAFVARRVAGVDVRSYPALVDRETSVDLVLLESAEAAESASRDGVLRLLALSAKGAVSSVAARLPAAFPKPNGALPSRAETESFRADVLRRILALAFAQDDLPRSRTAFETRLAFGAPRVPAAFTVWNDAIKATTTELDKTLRALRAAKQHPSGRNAIVDIDAQLEQLFTPDLVRSAPLGRFEQLPRYLRAAQARLARAVTDPRKDADKAAPFAPLWAQFLAKRGTVRDREAATELRWDFEELRVAIFAPELKTPFPVSVSKLAQALASLR